jgi:hypothetical protein
MTHWGRMKLKAVSFADDGFNSQTETDNWLFVVRSCIVFVDVLPEIESYS